MDIYKDFLKIAKKVQETANRQLLPPTEIIPIDKHNVIPQVLFQRTRGYLEKIAFQKMAIEKEKFVKTDEIEEIEAEICVLAIGQEYDATVANGTELEGKEIKINGVKTELWGAFAAGDLANKEKTVVHSIASAKKAAEEIEAYLEK